jgi:pyruvate kinase
VDLGLDPLTDKDRRDLDFVALHADLVGMSFVENAAQVASFQAAFTAYLVCCVAGYGCFALVKEDNPTP